MNGIPLVLGAIMAGIFVGFVSLCWVILNFMPRWTRPDIYFSVTIRPEFRQTPEAQRLEQRYRRQVALHTLIGGGLTGSSLLVLNIPVLSVGLLVGGLLWQALGSMAAMATTRWRVLPYAVVPVATRGATLQPRTTALAGHWWWLGPLLILAAFAACLGLRWDDIPNCFPTHWGPTGQPDAWANRSIASVFVLPAIGVAFWLMILGLAAGIAGFTRRIHSRGPGTSQESSLLRITQWILLGTAYWISLLTGTLSLLPLLVEMNSPLPTWIYAIVASELVLAGVATVILARIGQGGWRLGGGAASESALASEPPVGDHTPDSAWKLGLFYYNPDDPALFVEKRFGIGWDINWARRAAWLMLLALLALPLAVTVGFGLAVESKQVGPGPQATSQSASKPATEPMVVETYPTHGAKNVAPTLREVRIRFNQRMDQSTHCISPGGGSFPEIIGQPHWEDDYTFVLAVRVQPSSMYEVTINMGEGEKFRSQSGQVAPSNVIDFQTLSTSSETAK